MPRQPYESEGTWFSAEARAEPPPAPEQLLIGPVRRTQFGPMCRVVDCPRLICVYGMGMFCAAHQDQVNAGATVVVAVNAGRGKPPTKCTNPAHVLWSGGGRCAGPVTSYRQRLGVPMAGAHVCTP